MRLPRWRLGLVSLVALFLLSLPASAQNTTPGTAALLTIGQIPVYASVNNTPTDRWYSLQPRVGRSYCASATTGLSFDTIFFQRQPW